MPSCVKRFVGDKPVDSFPPEATRQIPDDVLRRRETERLAKGENKEPGAGRRAGAATRNPDGAGIFEYEPRTLNANPFTDYDTKGQGGHSSTVQMAGMIHILTKLKSKYQ